MCIGAVVNTPKNGQVGMFIFRIVPSFTGNAYTSSDCLSGYLVLRRYSFTLKQKRKESDFTDKFFGIKVLLSSVAYSEQSIVQFTVTHLNVLKTV